ncbi:Lsr2 family DNA-binding protein [Streptomyces thermolilacinus]|uniref:Lsr2 family DNA-binding protein n=1 Tax=Streptomyces thermolilacinus TaxID=285540 RepID=UPI0033E5F6B4
MTIAALRALLDEELPDVPRHPAPELPHKPSATARKEPPPVQPVPFTQPSTPAPAPAATPASAPIPVGQLLAWADQHEDPAVREQSAQARTALVGLRRRHAADQELQRLAQEQQDLEERLAAIQARQAELAPPKRRRRRTGNADIDSAAVRAWARQAGVACPPTGRPPAAVVDAWRKATQPHGGDRV